MALWGKTDAWIRAAKDRTYALLNPLPNPRQVADRYFLSPLHHLLRQHVETIIDIVVTEAEKSRRFGCFIEPEHLEKEFAFFLLAIDSLGDPVAIARSFTYEHVQHLLADLCGNNFEQELRYYFYKHTGERRMPTMYGCHLEAVRTSLVRSLYEHGRPKKL